MSSTAQSIIDDRRSRQRKAALACSEDDIWNASQTQEEPLWGNAKGFVYPLGSQDPEFFVKYTKTRSKWLLEPERRNHEFAFNLLRTQQQPAAQQGLIVCVPGIFRAFEHRDFYFLVMEFVPGRTLQEILIEDEDRGAGQGDHSMLYKYIAEGIRLLSVEAPPGSKPGPVGCGVIRHPFFNEFEAATPYREVEMLGAHMNKILRIRTRRSPNPPPTISLGTELQFYYSDLGAGNFIFTTVAEHPVLYIIDFDEAGFLTPIFMDFVLDDHATRPTSIQVAQNMVNLIKPKDDDNLQVMRTASCFVLSSIWYFGLPLESYPETELANVKRLRKKK